MIADIEAQALERGVAELTEMGCECLGQRADVTDPASVQAVLQETRQDWGPIHGLIHGAGVLAAAAVHPLVTSVNRRVMTE